MIRRKILKAIKGVYSANLGVLIAFQILFSNKLFAAGDAPLFSLRNTDFVVLIAFLAFFGLLIYLKVPTMISSLLDKRADSIKEEINDANKILEEAKSLLAELEREHKVNIERSEQIMVEAENEAKALLNSSKKEIRSSIERRIKIAEEQINSAEIEVIQSIKERAIDRSIDLAKEELIKTSAMKKRRESLVEKSIEQLKQSTR